MLSHPPPSSGLHARQQRQRQHRRQNSTPTAYETVKIAPNLANIRPSPLLPQQPQHHNQQQQQRPRVSHRRGMSLDTRRHQLQPNPRHEFHMVSTTNTTTGQANPPQQVVREAQQQSIARPGPQQPAQQQYENLALANSNNDYLVSSGSSTPQTPQMPFFDQQWCDGLPVHNPMSMSFDMYANSPMNVIIKKDQDDYPPNLNSPDFELFPQSTLSTPTFMNFPDAQIGNGWMSDNEATNSRRNSRRISNGILDRVSKFENMAQEPQQPMTPRQNENDYYPMTPMETPHGRTLKRGQAPQRFADGYDESNEETVKPARHRKPQRSQTVFEDMRQSTEALMMTPEPRRANTIHTAGDQAHTPVHTPDYSPLDQTHGDGLHMDTNSDGFRGLSYPLSESSDYSRPMSPLTPDMARFADFDFPKQESNSQTTETDLFSLEARTPNKHHRRTESTASAVSAASIASIDIEKTKTDTGITSDDIQQYIEGPDARDNKWICTFEACNKKFGRKENIKSHVQTHLNDRQFQCPACQKCFVRQHDLKRHAKIHTGIKPYPCLCGNSFARHDALTRHRQRGMCIGAFEGSAPKNAKRGRPRKNRPDDEERRDKAARTRRKNNLSVSSVSTSSYSDYSSPEQEFDMMDVSLGGTTLNPSSLQTSSAPMPSLASLELEANSPSAHSYTSHLSHMTLHSELPEHLSGSGSSSENSPATDPPELSHISSPPQSQFYDAEPHSSGLDLIGGLVLDCDSHLLFSSEPKFDDGYDMFTSSEDLIFGRS